MPEWIINSVPDGAITHRKTQWNGHCGERKCLKPVCAGRPSSSKSLLLENEFEYEMSKHDETLNIN